MDEVDETEVAPRWLEDFAIGQMVRSGEVTVTAASIRDFAARYDPQPMHLDEAAARRTVFGGLLASGWHTLALTMRLMTDARLAGGGPIIGVEVDEIRFLRPVRPGDRLHAVAEVLATRRSRAKPGRGYVQLRLTTANQDAAAVLTQRWTILVPARPPHD